MSLKMNLGSQRCCIINNIEGNTGTKGNIGPYGPIGQIGLSGTTGNTGPTGDTGLCYRGRQGAQGPVGEQGGFTGNAGPIGPVGSSGTDPAQNVYFTFTTINSSSSSYSSAEYTDLTGLASQPLNTNTIILGQGTYAINWEINEGWTDIENKFYVGLYNLSDYYYPKVFNSSSPCVLYSNLANNKIFGTGNDIINISNPDTYSIELLQSTNSTETINISNKTINFSITFVLI